MLRPFCLSSTLRLSQRSMPQAFGQRAKEWIPATRARVTRVQDDTLVQVTKSPGTRERIRGLDGLPARGPGSGPGDKGNRRSSDSFDLACFVW